MTDSRNIGELLVEGLADRIAQRVLDRLGDVRNPAKRLLTMEEAAEYLGRTKESVQHLVSAGKLPTVRSDRRVFLDVNDLSEWIESNKVRGI